MNLSDLLNIQMGDVMPGMRQNPRRLQRPQGATGEWDPRQPYGATGEWNPRQSYGTTGEWGPESQNVEDRRVPNGASGEWGTLAPQMAPPGQPPVVEQPAIPVVPAPAPSAFRKEPSQNPIDNPSIPVPRGTGMIRNTRTGAEYRLSSGGSAPSPDLDYARPIEVFGQGKGHYLKSDPMAAMVGGKRVDFGRDTGKERQLAREDLVTAKGQQALREGEADIALKQQKLSAKPKAPPNYRWTEDGNLERIPGGAADEKVVNAFHADTLGVQSATSAIDNLLGVANEVLNSPGLEGNYGLRGVLPNVPGGDAANAKALLQRLKDVAGFSALNDLKAAGKNGSSGLGSVTEFEHKILQNQLANLDKAQSVAQVKQEIANLVKATEASKQRLTNHYQSTYGKMLNDPGLNPAPAPVPATPTPSPAASAPTGKTTFDTLPDPTGFEGKVIRDSHTGQRLRATGGRWVPL